MKFAIVVVAVSLLVAVSWKYSVSTRLHPIPELPENINFKLLFNGFNACIVFIRHPPSLLRPLMTMACLTARMACSAFCKAPSYKMSSNVCSMLFSHWLATRLTTNKSSHSQKASLDQPISPASKCSIPITITHIHMRSCTVCVNVYLSLLSLALWVAFCKLIQCFERLPISQGRRYPYCWKKLANVLKKWRKTKASRCFHLTGTFCSTPTGRRHGTHHWHTQCYF